MENSYEYKLMVGLPQGTLIDIETTGLDSKKSEIITLGYISQNSLIIYQNSSPGFELFYKNLRERIQALPQPFYAYNASFEKEFITAKLEIEAEYLDLMDPWRTKAENLRRKWPKLDELLSEPETYFGELNLSGQDMPKLWKKFLKERNPEYLQQIIRHNRIDLLRELILLIHYDYWSLSQQKVK